MTGRDVDTRRRTRLANGKTQFRSRPRLGEDQRVTAHLGDDFGREIGKLAGEKARVVTDANFRAMRQLLARRPFLDVGDQTLRGAADVVIIHRVGARAGELGPPQRLRGSLLRGGHRRPDCFPAQPARAEGQRSEEPVVQLLPIAVRRQFAHTGFFRSRGPGGEEFFDVRARGGQQSAMCLAGLQHFRQITHKQPNIGVPRPRAKPPERGPRCRRGTGRIA